MTPQQLTIIANLIPLVSQTAAEALRALLNQSGIDPDRLLEMAAQNNRTALTLIESEINRVGASLPVTPTTVTKGEALLAELAPSKYKTTKLKQL